MALKDKMMSASTEKIVTYGIGAGITYFLIVKPILVKLGILKSAAEIEAERERAGRVDDYIDESLRRQTPTKSLGEWTIIANQIYEDLRYASVSDNKEDATYQICRAKNDADVAMLIRAFGTRQEYYFGIPYGGLQGLVSFVNSNLSGSQKEMINGNYSRKAIKFRF